MAATLKTVEVVWGNKEEIKQWLSENMKKSDKWIEDLDYEMQVSKLSDNCYCPIFWLTETENGFKVKNQLIRFKS